MNIAIIGSGLAGLGAARTLREAGHHVVIFEKSRGVGGRLATRRIGDFTFDTGATTLTPRTSELARLMTADLDTSDLVKVERPIYAMEYGRIAPGDPSRLRETRYAYRSGVTKLPKLLSDGIELRLDTQIGALSATDNAVQIGGELFDYAVLTAPAAQTGFLLTTAGEARPLGSVVYRKCLSVLLGFGTPNPEVPFFAVIDPAQRNPIVWISIESIKTDCRAPKGKSAMVVQMNRDYSNDHFEVSDDRLIQDALSGVSRLFGSQFSAAEVADVKRWRYSQPEMTVSFEAVNPKGARILVAGDSIAGGRAELAYDSGITAAKRILG
ncbi:MAG: FAD-dependent oxidoreductase [Armatimonadetes bacterium]|nr:FAD-dependent oxidoreductase [Armatimonadota bacterium]